MYKIEINTGIHIWLKSFLFPPYLFKKKEAGRWLDNEFLGEGGTKNGFTVNFMPVLKRKGYILHYIY